MIVDKSREEIAQEDAKRLQELYDEKCDEYRKIMLLNAALRTLLKEAGVDHDL